MNIAELNKGRQKIKKYLYVKGIAGLGNRIACACNAIEYCLRTSRVIFINWSDTMFSDGKHNLFFDYFSLKNIDHIEKGSDLPASNNFSIYPPPYQVDYGVHHYSMYWSWRHPICDHIPFPKGSRIRGRLGMLQGYWYYLPDRASLPSGWMTFFKGIFEKNNYPRGEYLPLALKNDLVVYADYIPSFSGATLANHIQLKAAFEKTLHEFRDAHDLSQAIGIHVRKTDKMPASSNFLHRIDRVIQREGLQGRKIFLATDNIEVLTAFKRKYSNVVTANSFFPSSDGAALHEWAKASPSAKERRRILEAAIVDMWLLADCEFLLYQGNSAFTVTPRSLHKTPKKCIDWDTG